MANGNPDKSTLEERNLEGLEVVDAYREIFGSSEVRDLTRDILGITYSKFFGDAGETFCHRVLDTTFDLLQSSTTAALKERLLDYRNVFQQSEMFAEYYGNFRERNLTQTIEYLGESNFIGVVADIGCDDNRLGQLILKNCKDVRRVIGVDVSSPLLGSINPKVEYRPVSRDTAIPIEDNGADTIVIRYALHHMRWETQRAVLHDAYRVLRPEGQLLILENAISESLPSPTKTDIDRRTFALHSDGLLRNLLTALDVFSLSIKDKTGPFPSTYRTLEEWTEFLGTVGFDTSPTYLGYPMQDLHQAPLTILHSRGR